LRKRSDDVATPACSSRYTSPFASASSPFAAAASADEGDVRVVNDTNPNPAAVESHALSAQQHSSSDAGSCRAGRAGKAGSDTGVVPAGAAAAAASGKPALSPFALLQCAQGDAGETC
jgi:hypothetical protein